VDFYAADGRTRLSVPPAFLTGSHTVSYVSEMAADEPAMAVHFRPGGAFPFLGMPLSDLENAYVGLDQVWGRGLLAESSSETGQPSAPIVVRTRLFDEALLRSHADGVSQVVIVAAGMDARSFRLPWPDGVTIYEVDQPQVIAIKEERLAGARPRCQRVPVGVDLADDWPKTLQSQGFNASAPTIWTIEGLLQYIEAPDVDRLFARVDALSAPGSVLLYDVVGNALLEAPFLQNTIDFMQKLGAPWIFGSDTPGALVEDRGWTTTVTDMAVPGNEWKRWAHPPIPVDVPNAPRGYFIEAMKA
jgi:methyltransferase (TIGR00027 family)